MTAGLTSAFAVGGERALHSIQFACEPGWVDGFWVADLQPEHAILWHTHHVVTCKSIEEAAAWLLCASLGEELYSASLPDD